MLSADAVHPEMPVLVSAMVFAAAVDDQLHDSAAVAQANAMLESHMLMSCCLSTVLLQWVMINRMIRLLWPKLTSAILLEVAKAVKPIVQQNLNAVRVSTLLRTAQQAGRQSQQRLLIMYCTASAAAPHPQL